MALLGNPTLTITVTTSTDGKSFILTDTTPNYGGPNIASSSVTTVKVTVFPYGATVPFLITFTVSANTITNAVLTAPDGTTTNVFSQLTSTVWPFDSTHQLTIPNTWLGFPSTAFISDQVWTIGYEIIGSYINLGQPVNFDLNTSVSILVYTAACCCVKKMFVNLGCQVCDDNNAFKNAVRAKASIRSAIFSAQVGQYDCAQKSLETATELCNCGCVSPCNDC